MHPIILIKLWLAIAGSDPTVLAVYANEMQCAQMAVLIREAWDKPPRAFLFRLACVPTIAGVSEPEKPASKSYSY